MDKAIDKHEAHDEANTQHASLLLSDYSHFGARRLSRSDWDPARAESEAKAHSAVWKQTLAWSRLGRKRSLASLIGGAKSDECQDTVKTQGT